MKKLAVAASVLALAGLPATALARGGTGGGGGGGGGGTVSTPPPPGADCYQWDEKGISVITARASIVMHGTGDLVNCSDHSVTVWFRETRTGPDPDLSAPVFQQGEPTRPLAATTIKPGSKLAYEWFLTNPAPSSIYEVKMTAVDATTGLDATTAIDEFMTPPA